MKHLFADDGAHPNLLGTYLAGCVFFATITIESPVGLGDAGTDLPGDQIAAAQRIAWELHETRRQGIETQAWPLSLPLRGNDLIYSDDLTIGDSIGPDGQAGTATQFSTTSFAQRCT